MNHARAITPRVRSNAGATLCVRGARCCHPG